MLELLQGNKTYICIGLAAVAYGLFLAGLIDHDQLDTILVGLGIPAAGFLRAAIAKQPQSTTTIIEKTVIQPPLSPQS